MHLAEDRELPRTFAGTPLPHPAFKRAAVRIEKLAGVVLAEPVKESLGQQSRLASELPFNLGPDRRERVDPGAVSTRRLLLAQDARERRVFAVMSGRLLGHPCPPGRAGQRGTFIEKLPHLADLNIGDHRRPPSSWECPMATSFRREF